MSPPSRCYRQIHLFPRVRCKLTAPREHPRVAHSAPDDPEQLIIWFVGRVQGKLRGVGNRVTSTSFFGAVSGVPWHPAQSSLKSFTPAIKCSSVGSIGLGTRGARRLAEAPIAMCASALSQ